MTPIAVVLLILTLVLTLATVWMTGFRAGLKRADATTAALNRVIHELEDAQRRVDALRRDIT